MRFLSTLSPALAAAFLIGCEDPQAWQPAENGDYTMIAASWDSDATSHTYPEDSYEPEAPMDTVVINGRSLQAREIEALAAQYGVQPQPGKYWYDAVSGLYGVVGYDAYGFMLPGHDFGPLDPYASGGELPISINGRYLSRQEYTTWSHLVGAWIQPGAYWLDASGNAGVAGNPWPQINLFQAAMQNRYRGQGASGDNFWSTRFSAGNANADNSQGYVSVPGHGPIGYGF